MTCRCLLLARPSGLPDRPSAEVNDSSRKSLVLPAAVAAEAAGNWRRKTRGFLDAGWHAPDVKCGCRRSDEELTMTGSIDNGHLLLVGAGPGLGSAIAHRFAAGGFRVTLVARSVDRLGDLARGLDDTGAEINTVEADASSPEDLRARMTELYSVAGAPGVVIYNAVLGAPDRLLSSTAAHLQEAYAVDVIGAIVVAQEAAPAMKAAGFGTIIVTGGGFADHPIPALATVSLGKAALRSSATMLSADLGPDGIRVATLTIAGQIAEGTAFDPAIIAERYWQVVQTDDPWQAEFRFTGE